MKDPFDVAFCLVNMGVEKPIEARIHSVIAKIREHDKDTIACINCVDMGELINNEYIGRILDVLEFELKALEETGKTRLMYTCE